MPLSRTFLDRIVRRFDPRRASSRPTSTTNHTNPLREQILEDIIGHLEHAREAAQADLRRAVAAFRTVFTSTNLPDHRERTLEQAWVVLDAGRVMHELELALIRTRSELTNLRARRAALSLPPCATPDGPTLELQAV